MIGNEEWVVSSHHITTRKRGNNMDSRTRSQIAMALRAAAQKLMSHSVSLRAMTNEDDMTAKFQEDKADLLKLIRSVSVYSRGTRVPLTDLVDETGLAGPRIKYLVNTYGHVERIWKKFAGRSGGVTYHGAEYAKSGAGAFGHRPTGHKSFRSPAHILV